MDFDIQFDIDKKITFSFCENKFEIFDCEEKEDLTTIYGQICVNDNQVGKIIGYIVQDNQNFFDRCDAVSGDLCAIANAVCNKDGSVSKKYLSNNCKDFEPIFILDKIEVDNKYRNKGIASNILKNLSKMLKYQFDFGSTIFLCASDYENLKNSNYEKGSKNLVKFYKKLGFKYIKNNVLYLINED